MKGTENPEERVKAVNERRPVTSMSQSNPTMSFPPNLHYQSTETQIVHRQMQVLRREMQDMQQGLEKTLQETLKQIMVRLLVGGTLVVTVNKSNKTTQPND